METGHNRLVLMLWALMCESALQRCVSSACSLQVGLRYQYHTSRTDVDGVEVLVPLAVQ